MAMTDEEEKYNRKMHFLSLRCESIQNDNKLMAKRLIKVKSQIKHARRLRMKLLVKLDQVEDQRKWDFNEDISKMSNSVTCTSQSLPSVSINNNANQALKSKLIGITKNKLPLVSPSTTSSQPRLTNPFQVGLGQSLAYSSSSTTSYSPMLSTSSSSLSSLSTSSMVTNFHLPPISPEPSFNNDDVITIN